MYFSDIKRHSSGLSPNIYIISRTLKFSFLYLKNICACVLYACMHKYYGIHMEVRGQLMGIYFLLLLCGF